MLYLKSMIGLVFCGGLLQVQVPQNPALQSLQSPIIPESAQIAPNTYSVHVDPQGDMGFLPPAGSVDYLIAAVSSAAVNPDPLYLSHLLSADRINNFAAFPIPLREMKFDDGKPFWQAFDLISLVHRAMSFGYEGSTSELLDLVFGIAYQYDLKDIIKACIKVGRYFPKREKIMHDIAFVYTALLLDQSNEFEEKLDTLKGVLPEYTFQRIVSGIIEFSIFFEKKNFFVTSLKKIDLKKLKYLTIDMTKTSYAKRLIDEGFDFSQYTEDGHSYAYYTLANPQLFEYLLQKKLINTDQFMFGTGHMLLAAAEPQVSLRVFKKLVDLCSDDPHFEGRANQMMKHMILNAPFTSHKGEVILREKVKYVQNLLEKRERNEKKKFDNSQ